MKFESCELMEARQEAEAEAYVLSEMAKSVYRMARINGSAYVLTEMMNELVEHISDECTPAILKLGEAEKKERERADDE